MHNKGSISISILIGSLFLAALTQTILIFSMHTKSSALEELEDYQLRKLCGSIAKRFETHTITDGTETWPDVILEPGHHKVKVIQTLENSDDALLSYMTIGAISNNDHSFYMRKLTVNLPNIVKEKVKDYPIIYKNSISGTEYLNNRPLYTSTKEEVMPLFKFLNTKAISSLMPEDAIQDGLSSRFYYLPTNTTFSFKSNSKIHGSTVFVNAGNINIASNCIFYDRIMLVSGAGNITIGKNVNFKKAVIIARGTISIDSDSKINGLIIGNQVILKGPITLSPDEEVVTPFSSTYFLNTSS